jgi:hypothetical protein
MKYVTDLLREADCAHLEGDRRKTIRRLEAALRLVRKMGSLQRLPDWVQVGASVVDCAGKSSCGVYVVVSVDRKPRGWSFRGEHMHLSGTIHSMGFRQETGKRSWRRYSG